MIEIYVPSHRLAEQLHDGFTQQSMWLRTKVIYGRDTVVDGTPMCARHALVRTLAAKGIYRVYPLLCQSYRDGERVRCLYWDECRWVKQYTMRADVAIYTHTHLPLGRVPLGDTQKPSHAIVDESFLTSLAKFDEWTLADLLGGCRIDGLIPAIMAAIQRGAPLVNAASPFRAALEAALANFQPVMPMIFPDQCDDGIAQGIAGYRPSSSLYHLYVGLIAALNGEVQRVWWDGSKEKLCVARFDFPVRLEGVPTLLLDATAPVMALTHVLPQLEHHKIPVRRNLRVTQVFSSSFPTSTKLIPVAKGTRYLEEAERLQTELAGYIHQLMAQHGPDGLLVGPKKFIKEARGEGRPLSVLPGSVATAHFGSLRGVNKYKDCDWIVVVGRNQPPPKAVDNLARVIYGQGLNLTGEYAKAPRGYQLSSGEHYGVEVSVHPDERVDELLRQIREAETTQAIDRLRLIHNEKPKVAILFCNIPHELEVDVLRCEKNTLAGGSRLEQVFWRLGGILPLSPKLLAIVASDLFSTPEAARAEIKKLGEALELDNQIKSGGNANSNTISIQTAFLDFGQGSLNAYQYHLEGMRGRHTVVLSAHNAESTTKRIEFLSGGAAHIK